MVQAEIQRKLFEHIKATLPVHLSLAEELGELLDLSNDSVYRRMRGEKSLSLLELKTICTHYQLSLDQILQLESDTVIFKTSDLNIKSFPFIDILKNMLKQFTYFNAFTQKEMIYLCKDMPFWIFYLIPELGAFKSFFWAKTIHNEARFHDHQFSLKDVDFTEFTSLGKKINSLYNQIPSVEIWNDESINSTISQVKFYIESDGFKSKQDIITVIDALEKTIDHVKKQAEVGFKFDPGASELAYKASYQLYMNEIVIGSNTILALLDGNKVSFLPYNVFNFMYTTDPRFNDSVFAGINLVKSKSTLISSTGEKDRNKFFASLKSRIDSLRKLQ